MNKPLRRLLADYVALLNQHGVDSREERVFNLEYQHNAEFNELAKTARWLKRQLSIPPSPDKDAVAELVAACESLLEIASEGVRQGCRDDHGNIDDAFAREVVAGHSVLKPARELLARLRKDGAS